MSELILHHYPMSPCAEKARLMLGFKKLPWRSVIIPPVMPKPDVVALTGGHRKPPILQGADVYCDTALTEALAAAAGAGAHAPTTIDPGLGFEAGQAVTVAATDYGVDPVAGTLVGLNLQESVLRRTDPRAGTLQVHFPRFGFQIRADKA